MQRTLAVCLTFCLFVSAAVALTRSVSSRAEQAASCNYVPGIGPKDAGISKPLTVCQAAVDDGPSFRGTLDRSGPGAAGFPSHFSSCEQF
jgi:hypothetical protein